jgi:hypothetical protein
VLPDARKAARAKLVLKGGGVSLRRTASEVLDGECSQLFFSISHAYRNFSVIKIQNFRESARTMERRTLGIALVALLRSHFASHDAKWRVSIWENWEAKFHRNPSAFLISERY